MCSDVELSLKTLWYCCRHVLAHCMLLCCSLQLPPSEWRGAQLKLTRPRRLVMPLVVGEPPTGLQVLQGLPHVGTALPVVVLPGAVPSTGVMMYRACLCGHEDEDVTLQGGKVAWMLLQSQLISLSAD